jgi:hypothetical protein
MGYLRYLMICCLLLASLTLGCGKKSATEEAPQQTPPTQDNATAVLSEEELKNAPPSYRSRLQLIKYKSTDIKERRRELINFFLTEQSKGRPTEYCFCEETNAAKLFAVRSWEIVFDASEDPVDVGRFKVRIDSSNKGGSQVTILWNIHIEESPHGKGDLCISLIFSNQGS